MSQLSGTARTDDDLELAAMTRHAANQAAVRPGGLPRLANATGTSRLPGRRLWRGALALGLLGAGLYAVLDDQLSLSTEHAVVSGYTTNLRSPIAGTVTGLRQEAGAEVAPGTVLATVEDDRIDRQRLAEFRAQQARASAELAAAEAARDRLREMQQELASRGDAHREVAAAWYANQITEVEQRLLAGEARRHLARLDLDRKLRLQASGFVATAELDRARAEHDLATGEAEALAARLVTLRTQAAGVRQGIFVDAGQSGAAYTAQRLDEISLRLADLGRNIAALRAEIAGSADRLAEEERRIAQLRQAALAAPAGGMLWRLHAQDGERVAPGDKVAEIADCSAAFVLAAVPQDRANNIRPGAPARLRLAGESEERAGRVVAVMGESAVMQEQHLAARPTQGRGSHTLLRIALPPAEAGSPCLIGRSARLLLPAERSGFLGRTLAALQ